MLAHHAKLFWILHKKV